MICLVRLRLGLKRRQLAFFFPSPKISSAEFLPPGTLFKETLVLWPRKEAVKENLPRSFKKYPNTWIIIDCTEVFMEKPASPYAQRATWSEYKEYNTIKALVGITPSGYFSFLFKFWTGSTSDRKITHMQESQLVDLLEDGDSNG